MVAKLGIQNLGNDRIQLVYAALGLSSCLCFFTCINQMTWCNISPGKFRICSYYIYSVTPDLGQNKRQLDQNAVDEGSYFLQEQFLELTKALKTK